jgi:hypothetical protein
MGSIIAIASALNERKHLSTTEIRQIHQRTFTAAVSSTQNNNAPSR